MEKISVVIQTYNSERWLERVLDAVAPFDEILLCDMHSTDRTLEIARARGCRIVFHPKCDYCEPARDFAIQSATYDRVLVVDSDELVPEALVRHLYAQTERADCPAGIRIPRKNYFMGRMMHSDYPDHILRFLDKRRTVWGTDIHCKPHVDGLVETIPASRSDLAFIHLAENPMPERIAKLNTYTGREVDRRLGRHYGAAAALYLPLHRFLKAYLLKGGFRDGRAGLVNAGMDAFYRFVVLAKLWERQRAASAPQAETPAVQHTVPNAHQAGKHTETGGDA